MRVRSTSWRWWRPTGATRTRRASWCACSTSTISRQSSRAAHISRRPTKKPDPFPTSLFRFLFLFLFVSVIFYGGWDLILLLKFSFNLSLNFTTVSNDSEKIDRSIEKVIGDFLIISLVFFIIQPILCSTFGLYCQLQLNRFCIFF